MWAASAPHAEIGHHGYILVEQLMRLAMIHPEMVVAVFRSSLSGFLPEYPPEDVISCVMQLAEAGLVDEAEEICNEYGSRDSILLKETYLTLRDLERKGSLQG